MYRVANKLHYTLSITLLLYCTGSWNSPWSIKGPFLDLHHTFKKGVTRLLPDLSPLDCALWGSVKDEIFARNPLTLEQFRQLIQKEFITLDEDKDLNTRICNTPWKGLKCVPINRRNKWKPEFNVFAFPLWPVIINMQVKKKNRSNQPLIARLVFQRSHHWPYQISASYLL